jgi:hypothetical protein
MLLLLFVHGSWILGRCITVTNVCTGTVLYEYLVVTYRYLLGSYCRLFYFLIYYSMQSAQFEDFLVEFLNRCFAIIENSIVLETRAEVHIAPLFLCRLYRSVPNPDPRIRTCD